MKTKISKILGVALTSVLLVSLMMFAIPTPVSANPGNNFWDLAAIPTDGVAGGWVLAAGQTTQPIFDVAVDGTMYAYADPGGAFGLFKSTNGGATWSRLVATPVLAAAAVALVCSPTDADTFYVTDGINIWKSEDGGATFVIATTPLAGAGIACMDVVEILPGVYVVVVGENTAPPSIQTYDESLTFPVWVDTNFVFPGGVAVAAGDLVRAVKFSPDFATDRGILAAVMDVSATSIYLESREVGGGWNLSIAPATLSAALALFTGADIAFPDDYDVTTANIVYVGIATGADTGNIYLVFRSPGASTATAIGAVKDIYSLDVAGGGGIASILAGGTVTAGAFGPQIYYSPDSTIFVPIAKVPAGVGNGTAFYADVKMSADFVANGTAWCIIGGNEGGFSVSTDYCNTWNQLSLILSAITNITDFAPNADGTVLFMCTDDATDAALWKFSGGVWQRTLCILGFTGMQVELSPDFATTNAVFVTGAANRLWRSLNGGTTFTAQPNNVPANVTTFVVINVNRQITGNAAGGVNVTTLNGLAWFTYATGAGANAINSIALSPAFATDANVLVGAANGGVFRSATGGTTWAPVGAAFGAGATYVAFDPAYATNSTIYAGWGAAAGGLYRYVVTSPPPTPWTAIDAAAANREGAAALPNVSQVVVSADGTLYASEASGASAQTMSRCLNPTAGLLGTTDTALYTEQANDAAAGATLGAAVVFGNGLWLAESGDANTLWAVDTAAAPDVLYTYTDNLAVSPTLTLSAATATTLTFTWGALTGATSYTLQVNARADFNGATGAAITWFGPDTAAIATGLVGGAQYYARLRVGQDAGGGDNTPSVLPGTPVLSRWSTVEVEFTQLPPVGVPTPLAPAPGAQNVNIIPVFDWNPVAGATGYTIEVATDPDFADIVCSATVPIDFWQCDTLLEYDTSYYWRVFPISTAGPSAGPAINSDFHTLLTPAVEPTIYTCGTCGLQFDSEADLAAHFDTVHGAVGTPVYIWVVIAVGAVLVIAVIVLIARTRGAS